ncbi:hypothetical protein H311_01400 [Anncaliia algerae PRA109]|nr:hypothetical protein H311_01400 [Anncaliia algerae PRA109]
MNKKWCLIKTYILRKMYLYFSSTSAMARYSRGSLTIINGSVICTDEHKSYSQLTSKGFLHLTVCHKYNFVDKETGTHTQAVESFNNCIKIAIKKRKGVVVQSRQDFLNEICWLFNNKENRLERILNIIKA